MVLTMIPDRGRHLSAFYRVSNACWAVPFSAGPNLYLKKQPYLYFLKVRKVPLHNQQATRNFDHCKPPNFISNLLTWQ